MKTQSQTTNYSFGSPWLLSLLGAAIFLLLTTTKLHACSAAFSWFQDAKGVVYFKNSSTGAHNNFYVWYFGDYDSTITANPSHTYATPGKYKVTLIVRDSVGCKDTVSDSVTVYPTCDASYTYSTNYLTAYFNKPYKVGRSYYWDFGDGSSSTDTLPVHKYKYGGSYYVTLVITTGLCKDSVRKLITVYDTATCRAGFTYTHKGGHSVEFINTSYTTSKNLIFYNYSFGDGNVLGTSSMMSTSYTHTYSKAGKYAVRLIMKDSLNYCSDTVTDTVVIVDCDANFGYTANYLAVNFSANTGTASTKYMWSFGDGTSGTGAAPQHTYNAAGTYTVCLAVTDVGCTDTVCKTVTVAAQPKCTASFTVNTNGLSVNIKPDTSWAGYNNASFYWTFSDGTNASGKTAFNKAFSKGGLYVICLYVTNGTCTTSVCDSIIVTSPPNCKASFTVGSNGLNASIMPDTSWSGYSASKYSWSFGDGTSGSSRNSFSHTYSSAGKYTICLTVTNGTCADTFCDTVVVTNPTYKISGSVSLYGSSTTPGEAVVYLVKYNSADTTLSLLDTIVVQTDTSGNTLYSFSGLNAGTYYLKAALTSNSSSYLDYLPTYYDTVLTWGDATAITITNANATADISLLMGQNSGGPGFIAGKISQGANKKEGDPLKDVLVMLLDVNKKPVAYTYSDVDGKFSFSNLAYGTYEIYTEVTGLPTIPGYVTLSEENKTVDKVEVIVSSTGVTTKINTVGIKTTQLFNNVKLYPSPVHNTLMLDINSVTAEKLNVSIYGISGKCLDNQQFTITKGNNVINLDVKHFSAGLYMLKLKTSSGREVNYKFIKAE